MSLPKLNAGDAYLAATVAIWGLTFPVSKQVLGVLDPLAFAGMRWGIAGLVLVAVVGAREKNLRVPFGDFLRMAALGLLGVTTLQVVWVHGLQLTTAAKASIMVSTTPVFAVIGGAFIGRMPKARAWIGAALGFAGVFLLINNSLTEITLGGGSPAGDLLMLSVGAIWAAYSAGSATVIARHGALKSTFWIMLVGSVALVAYAWPDVRAVDWLAVPLPTWAGLLYTSVFAAALGFVWWYEGIDRLGPTRAMLYSYLIPVFGVVSSAAMLGDVMTGVQFLGAAVALGGVALARSG